MAASLSLTLALGPGVSLARRTEWRVVWTRVGARGRRSRRWPESLKGRGGPSTHEGPILPLEITNQSMHFCNSVLHCCALSHQQGNNWLILTSYLADQMHKEISPSCYMYMYIWSLTTPPSGMKIYSSSQRHIYMHVSSVLYLKLKEMYDLCLLFARCGAMVALQIDTCYGG